MSDRRRRNEGSLYWHARHKLWVGQIRLKDGRRKTRYFPGKPEREPREARLWVQEQAAAARAGALAHAGRTTLGDAIDHWFDLHPNWARNTIKSYRSQRRHLAALEPRRIEEITVPIIRSHLARLQRDGLSSGTVSIVRIIIRGALDEAVEAGLIVSNPAERARIAKAPPVEHQTWNPDGARRFLSCVMADSLAPLYLLALTTGARHGELRAIRWEDIDFERGLVMLTGTIEENGDRKSWPKGRRHRIAPLGDIVAAKLAGMDRTCELVFHRDRQAIRSWQLREHFYRMCDQAGVPRIQPHEMRHTVASRLTDAGVNLKLISELLGHANVSTTGNIYAHPDIDAMRSVAGSLESMFITAATTQS